MPTGIAVTSGAQIDRREQRARGRQRAERRGRLAEWLAAGALMLKGYRLLARRQRGPFGEIDLIAVRGNRIAFIEVKQRRSGAEAAAALAIP